MLGQLSPSQIIIKHFPPPFSAFEGIIQFRPNYYPNISPLHCPLSSFEEIIHYQGMKYLDLSERLDTNFEFIVQPNHAFAQT